MIPGDPLTFEGQIDGLAPQPAGSTPDFVNMSGDDFHPTAASPLVGAGVTLMDTLPSSYLPLFSYSVGQTAAPRDDSSAPTQGAHTP